MMGGFTFWVVIVLAVTTIQTEAAVLRKDSHSQVYIVFLDDSKDVKSPTVLLSSVLETSKAADSLIYIYKSLNGFAARLNTREAHKLANTPGVASVLPEQVYYIDDPPFSKGVKLGLDDEAFEPSPSENWP